MGRYFCDEHLHEYMQLCREHGDAAAEPIRKMDKNLTEMYKREGPNPYSTGTWHFFG
jgi:hypothetical protein